MTPSFPERTFNPNHLWLAQQIRNVSMWCEDEGLDIPCLIRDNGGKFGKVFDQMVESCCWEVVRTSLMAPYMNAFTEAFIATTRRECPNHFVFLSMTQLDNVLHS